jgi:hypothetical protein
MGGRDVMETLASATAGAPPMCGVTVGELVALAAEDGVPMVRHAMASRALSSRTVVDLHGAHIGRQVVLMFENGDPTRPIVIGVLRGSAGWPLKEQPAEAERSVDEERLVIDAQSQLVLRCGKASITLTRAGKVLIEGAYVLSRSTGVNRIKGGSVQLN